MPHQDLWIRLLRRHGWHPKNSKDFNFSDVIFCSKRFSTFFWGAFFLSNNLLRSLGKRWAPAIQMLCLSWATWLDGWEGPMEYIRGPPLNATFPHKKYGLIKGVIKGSWWWRITFDNALCLLGGGGVGAPLGSHDTWMMNEVWDQFLKNWDVYAVKKPCLK